MRKICFATIIGRPNVGKSSLLNKILNFNLSIVTATPQTTRDQITGVYTDNDSQIIFIDTPGIHKPLNKLGDHLNKNALDTVKEVDLVLFLSPADEELGKGDLMILEQLKNAKHKIAVISKIDKINDPTILTNKIEALNEYGFDEIVSESINKPKSIEALIKEIKKYTYEDVEYYDEDYITDKSMRFLAKEIIRESAINALYEELPHSIAVEVVEFNEIDEKHLNIDALIYVKKNSQKGMVIGAKGSKIKEIGRNARLKMQVEFNASVVLNLNVKVAKKWVDDEALIKRFGY